MLHAIIIVTICLLCVKGLQCMNIKTCKIKLLNKTYEIKCPEQEESNLLLAAKKLNEQMQQNSDKNKNLDSFQTLLLAALDVSRELILCKNEQAHQRLQVAEFISSLETKINKVVGGDIKLLTD